MTFSGTYKRGEITDKLTEANIAMVEAREGWEGALQALRPPVTVKKPPEDELWLVATYDSSRELAEEWRLKYVAALSNWTLLKTVFAKTSGYDAKNVMLIPNETEEN